MAKRIQYPALSYIDLAWQVTVFTQTNIPTSNWKQNASYSVASIAPYSALVPPTIGSNSWAERPQIDKFMGYQNIDPVADWKYNAQYSIAAASPYTAYFTNENNLPYASVFSGQDVTITYPTTVIYQSYFNPVTQISASVLVSDWFTPTEQPVRDISRTQYLYNPEVQSPQFVGPYAVPQMQSTPIVFQTLTQYQKLTQPITAAVTNIIYTGSSVSINYQSDFQYQMWAKPILPPTTAITLDQSLTTYPDKVYDVVREQYLYPNLSFSEFQFKENVSIDRFAGQKPDIIYDLKREQYAYPSFFFDPIPLPTTTVLVSDWFTPIEQPIRDISRTQYLDQSYFFYPNTIETVDIVIIGGTETVHFPTVFIYPTWSFFVELTTVPTVLVSDWFMPTQQPIRDIARTQYLDQSFTFSEFQFIENTSIDRYEGNKPDKIYDIAREQYVYPYVSFDPYPFPSPVFYDKWALQTNTPPKDVVRNQYLYPSLFFSEYQFIENVSIDRFEGYKPDIIFDLKREQYAYPSTSFFDFLAIPTQEPLNSFSYHPDVIFDIKHNQYLYPSYMAEFVQIDIPTIDKWLGNHPDIRFDIKRLQYIYPSLFFTELTETLPLIEATKSYHPDIIFDLKREQYVYPYFSISPTALLIKENITPDKWIGYHPDFVFDVKRNQYLYPLFFISPVAFFVQHIIAPPTIGYSSDQLNAATFWVY